VGRATVTFSIVARDPSTGAFGAGVATGVPVVGGLVLHLAADVGAIATQGLSTNPFYGIRGLGLLEAGLKAEDVCRKLIAEDDGRESRQLAIIDRSGQTASWTGADNVEAKHAILANDVAVAANWVASREVAVAVKAAFEISDAPTFTGKLIDALLGGELAGGDSRGLLSAAVRVVCRDHPPVDLRVDFDPRPILRLAEIHRATLDPDFQAFLARVPTIADPTRR
jgi:uncharacterized Ntn-hydrolase superfamily protein